MKFNLRYVIGISLISALGGFLFGYDWVVIGGAKPFYERFFEITQLPGFQGFAMSSALIGCIGGALVSGWISEKFGRKGSLLVAALLFTLSAVGTGAVSSFAWFMAFRIAGGFGIGLASAVSPVYIAEISPAKYRGRLVTLNQLNIVFRNPCCTDHQLHDSAAGPGRGYKQFHSAIMERTDGVEVDVLGRNRTCSPLLYSAFLHS